MKKRRSLENLFGVEHLDDLLQFNAVDRRCRFPSVGALIGEEGTHKSRLARSFLAQGLNDGSVSMLLTFGQVNDLKTKIAHHLKESELNEDLSSRLIHRRLGAQGISADRFVHVVLINVFEACKKELRRFSGGELAEFIKGLPEGYQGKASAEIVSFAKKKKVEYLVRWLQDTFPNQRVPWAENVRIVFDDLSQFRANYPDVNNNHSFLGYLVDVLKNIGVSCLIVDTQPGSPFDILRSDTDRELRSYTDYCVYTWTIRLGGQPRVAVTVTPAVSNDRPSVIRELRGAKNTNERKDSDDVEVDRHLELYSFSDEGEPRLTPIRAIFTDETQGRRSYLAEAEGVIRHSTGHTFSEEAVILNRTDEWIRGMLNRRPKNLSSHETLLIQVDNWWINCALDAGNVFTQQFLPIRLEARYEANDDPALANPIQRAISATPESGNKLIPYYWTFGFLLLRHQVWLRGRVSDLLPTKMEHASTRGNIRQARALATIVAIAEQLKSVGHDWKEKTESIGDDQSERDTTQHEDPVARYSLGSPVPWVDFLGACNHLRDIEASMGRSQEAGFGFHLACPSGESLNCLVLEMWLSCYDDLSTKLSVREKELEAELLSACRTQPGEGSDVEKARSKLRTINDTYRKLITEGAERRKASISETLPCAEGLDKFLGQPLAQCSLFLTLLQLAEALDVKSLICTEDPLDIGNTNQRKDWIASREWYSTAVSACEQFDATDPLVPFSLPGQYSTRGDWFLAAMKESRSEYMAQLAIQGLSSPRAAMDRMQRGIGLPFHTFSENREGSDALNRGHRTAIRRTIEGRVGYVYYDDLRKIAPSVGCLVRPIWRGTIKDYPSTARLFRRWVVRCLVDLMQVMEGRKDDWVRASELNFSIRDFIATKGPEEWLNTVVIKVESGRGDDIKVQGLDAYRYWFKPLLAHLMEDFKGSLQHGIDPLGPSASPRDKQSSNKFK